MAGPAGVKPGVLVLALFLTACAAAGPYLEAAPYEPVLSAPRPSPAPTPAWWSTVQAELRVPHKALALPAMASTPLITPGWSWASLPGGTMGAAATPVAYEDLLGRIIFRTDREGLERLYVMDGDGGNPRPLYTREEDFLGSLGLDLYRQALARQSLSPDGSHQVVVQDAWGRAQLFIRRLSDGAGWQLTRQGAGLSYDPAWQPSGDLIVFTSSESGNDEIWTIRCDGTDARQLTGNTWEWDKSPSWSPDGSRIVFWSNREGRKQVYVMDADGTGQRNISESPHDDWDPIWVR